MTTTTVTLRNGAEYVIPGYLNGTTNEFYLELEDDNALELTSAVNTGRRNKFLGKIRSLFIQPGDSEGTRYDGVGKKGEETIVIPETPERAYALEFYDEDDNYVFVNPQDIVSIVVSD